MTLLLILILCAAAFGQEQPADPPRPRRDTIVVTGTFEPVPLEDADRSITALDVAGATLLAGSFADFLRLDPSLDLRQRAPNAVQSDLSIRGGTFGQTLVLLDGIRLNDAQSGHHNMDIPVPLDSVSRIEILRGSGSTLYGSDAVGGVVNVITSVPEYSEFRLRTALGNFGVNQQSGVLSFARGRFAQQLTFSRDFSSGFIPNRDYRNLSFGVTTHLKTAWGTTRLVLAHNDRPFGAERFYGNFNSWERTRTWFAALRQELGDRTEVSFAFRRHTDLFVLHRDRPEIFTNRHAVEGFQAALRRHEKLSGNARLHYGVEGYRDSIDSTNLGSHARGRGAGYAALDVRSLRRFSFTLGARAEIYRRVQAQFSPSVSAGAWLSPRFKLRGNVSRAFRLPSYTDLYYHDPANQGSPNLRPERAWNYEAGLDWNASPRLGGGVTAFQRRQTDGIDYIRYSPDDIWRAANIQRLRISGVEAFLGAAVTRSHRFDLRYTALHGARDALGGVVSRYVFNYPSHAAVASWQAALPKGLLARSRLGVTQRYGRDAYAVVDVYVARGRGRLRPFLHLTNLGDARYEEISGIPMPGRGVLGGIEVVVFGGPN